MASWKHSVAAGAQDPMTMPPMSIRWAELTTHATRLPSTNTGCWTMTSCACRPPPLCGSLARNTSPEAMVSPWRAIVERTAFIAAPKWYSMRPPPLIRLPSASSRVAE